MAAPRIPPSDQLTQAERAIAERDLGRIEGRIERITAFLEHEPAGVVKANLEHELDGLTRERWLIWQTLGAKFCDCGRAYFDRDAHACPRCLAIDGQRLCTCGKPGCRRYETPLDV